MKNARSVIPEEKEELFVVYQWYEELELLVHVSLSGKEGIS